MDKPTLDQLREIRTAMTEPAGTSLDHAVLGILLDDLIERREHQGTTVRPLREPIHLPAGQYVMKWTPGEDPTFTPMAPPEP